MNNVTLAQSYLVKAQKRLKILDVLLDESAFSDVMREAQEIVELALKGLLRQVGIEPPKWHDVSSLILEFRGRFPQAADKEAERLAGISSYLRKERELSFYGDIDFIPTEEYSRDDALRAIADARFVVEIAEQVIKPG
ncbi:MAG: HEPN domain-containing protein [Chloroflexota bacterium]